MYLWPYCSSVILFFLQDLLLFSEDDVTHFISCTEEPLEKSTLPVATASELSKALLRVRYPGHYRCVSLLSPRSASG